MQASSTIALLLILGLGYWIAERSKEKDSQAADLKARDSFMALVHKVKADGITDDLVSWLATTIATKTSGKYDLNYYTKQLTDLLEKDGKRAVIVELMLLQQQYSDERQKITQDMQWLRYINSFRQMNKAQQKHEIARLKKIFDPQSDDDTDKLNTLELISLEDVGESDVLVGGIKLFTVRKKQ